jgi:four helix bundle protein
MPGSRNAIRRYERLEVYQVALNLVTEAYRLSKLLPKSETFALADQLKRAATSVVLNLVEGAGRGTDPDFRRFVRQAIGSVLEVDAISRIGLKLAFWQEDDLTTLTLTESVYFKLVGLEKSLKID